MSGQIKFHLDENVSNAVAEGFRRRGITSIWEWVDPEDMIGQVEFI